MTAESPSQSQSVTIRDVAARVGVAVSTVSRALRNERCISVARREAVQATAKELGYRPNPLVSALMAQVRPKRHAHHPVAVAILDCFPRGQRSFSEDYERAIHQRAEAFGYRIESLRLEDLVPRRRLDRVLDARGIRGLIVLPVPVHVELEGVSYERLAAATVDPSLKRPHMHRASADYFQGMTAALTRLVALGCTRIGFVTATTEVARIGDLWLAAFLLWQSKLPTTQRLAVHMPQQDSVAAFRAWLRREQPDAIVSNMRHPFDWLPAAGVRCPRDLVYAHLNVRAEWPAAGIDQHHEQVAWAAFDLVVSQLNRNEYGLPATPQTVLIEGTWSDGPTALWGRKHDLTAP